MKRRLEVSQVKPSFQVFLELCQPLPGPHINGVDQYSLKADLITANNCAMVDAAATTTVRATRRRCHGHCQLGHVEDSERFIRVVGIHLNGEAVAAVIGSSPLLNLTILLA